MLDNLLNEINEMENITEESLKTFFHDEIHSSITMKEITTNIYLVHNDYYVKCNSPYYDDCRSFVIELKDGKVKLIAYTYEKMKEHSASSFFHHVDDVYYEGIEGTTVLVFHYNNKWHFTTTRCTDIDASYFHDSDVSFGSMLDDCINHNRHALTSQLNPFHCYVFLIIHHKNIYTTDYADKYGEKYAKLMLVLERDVENMEIQPLTPLSGVLHPTECSFEKEQKPLIICKRDGKMHKVVSDEYVSICKKNPNYPHKWQRYLQIFIDNDPNYKLDDYIRDKGDSQTIIIDGHEVNPTAMLYFLYKGTSSVLYNIVNYFTAFFPEGRYEKLNGSDYEDLSGPYHSVLRNQIFTIQSLVNKNKITSETSIVGYLRKSLNVIQFCYLLKSIYLLRDKSYCNITNDRYKSYLTHFVTVK